MRHYYLNIYFCMKFLYIMDPRIHWLMILFVRSSEYFVLIVVGKNIFEKKFV